MNLFIRIERDLQTQKNKCTFTKRDSWDRGKRDKLGVWD